MVEIDRMSWHSDREWHRHQASLAGRLLTLSAERPSDHLQQESSNAILQLDPESRLLSHSHHLEMQYCYQIALYLSHYLNAISFNTATPEIRSNLQILRSKMAILNLESVRSSCRRTLFMILLNGALASRCHPERVWFVTRLSDLYSDIRMMSNVFDFMSEFTDPSSVVLSTNKEVWEHVLNFRASASRSTDSDTMDLDVDAELPMSTVLAGVADFQSPDLSVPLEMIETDSLQSFPDLHIS